MVHRALRLCVVAPAPAGSVARDAPSAVTSAVPPYQLIQALPCPTVQRVLQASWWTVAMGALFCRTLPWTVWRRA